MGKWISVAQMEHRNVEARYSSAAWIKHTRRAVWRGRSQLEAVACPHVDYARLAPVLSFSRGKYQAQ